MCPDKRAPIIIIGVEHDLRHWRTRASTCRSARRLALVSVLTASWLTPWHPRPGVIPLIILLGGFRRCL